MAEGNGPQAMVAWLRAQVDEDEHVAQMAAEDASAGASWHVERTYRHSGHAGIEGENGEVIAHIARHDPARALREVAAKRAILALHQAEPGQHPDFCGHDLHELPCPTQRRLALAYADRPGYRQEWAPL